MLYIFISIVVMVITILGITLFMMWLTDKTSHASLTERFKDAEFILNEHCVPEHWLRATPLFTRIMQGRFFRELRVQDTKTSLLSKLDSLISYFETAPFFASEEVRNLMLEQLQQEREQWQIELPISSKTSTSL